MSHRSSTVPLLLALLPLAAGCSRPPLKVHMPDEDDGAAKVASNEEIEAAQEEAARKPEDIESFLAIADEEPKLEVKLLKAGKKPLRTLSYAIEAGEQHEGTLDLERIRKAVEVGGEGLKEDIVETATLSLTLEVLDVSDKGDVLVRARLGKIEDAPPLPSTLAGLVELEGTMLFDRRGLVRAFEVELLPSSVSPQAGGMIPEMRGILLWLLVPLPEAEVGVGARWQVERQDTPLDDYVASARTVYELRKVSEDEVTIRASYSAQQPRRAFESERIRKGTSGEALDLRGTGGGEVVLRLDRVLARVRRDVALRARVRVTRDSQTRTFSVDYKVRQLLTPAARE